MSKPDGTELIGAELLYRRIPASTNWYDPESDSLSRLAFMPNKNDVDGITLLRAEYMSIEQAAQGRGSCYYVAVLSADDLRAHGIEVEPTPHIGGPAHASVPVMNASARRDSHVHEMADRMTTLCLRVQGPFHIPDTLADREC